MEPEPSVAVHIHTGNPSTKELRQKGSMFKSSLNYIVRTFSQNSVNLRLEHRGAQAVKCSPRKHWARANPQRHYVATALCAYVTAQACAPRAVDVKTEGSLWLAGIINYSRLLKMGDTIPKDDIRGHLWYTCTHMHVSSHPPNTGIVLFRFRNKQVLICGSQRNPVKKGRVGFHCCTVWKV